MATKGCSETCKSGLNFVTTNQVSKEDEQDLDKLAELVGQGMDLDKAMQEVEGDGKGTD
jgi:hypothetical protein